MGFAKNKFLIAACLTLMVALVFVSNAGAHFTWVLLPEPGSRQFAVVFSEGLHPDNPDYLSRLADSPVIVHGPDGKSTVVALQLAEDKLVGEIPKDFDAIALEIPVTWGVIERGGERFLLKYRALGLLDLDRASSLKFTAASAAAPALELSRSENKLVVKASVGQAPMGEAQIKVIGASEPQELTTDSQGLATWNHAEANVYGLFVKASHQEEGQHNGQPYAEVRTYATLSVRLAVSTDATDEPVAPFQSVVENEPGIDLPELPFGITSFGAARIGDAIYAYGGHTGSAHSYWNTSQSNQLLRWDLNSANGSWEAIAEGSHRLQGLAMVGYGDRLILVGGFFAKNAEGEPHQLHSQDQVSVFDTVTKQWSDLPALPSGRSSHDAIVHGDKLYVVGGWNMKGSEATIWHDTALVMDLKAANPTWVELPSPGFERRALALAAFEDKIFAVGGMERQGTPTRRTSIFDTTTQRWSHGPELVGTQDMVGFGAACWELDGKLVATTYDGSVQVLSEDQKQWRNVGQTSNARFFHRMLPLRPGQLVLFGGANMESGKFTRPEVIRWVTTESTSGRTPGSNANR
ncbi:MAG: hypothetical protein JNL67_10935 [Planctomycetaceae bacterium]|nr:hypothetical protein [Planctomycetaceae bacterium]